MQPRSFSAGSAIGEISQNRRYYIYVGTSAALAFALYGHLLGRHADHLAKLSETDPLPDYPTRDDCLTAWTSSWRA